MAKELVLSIKLSDADNLNDIDPILVGFEGTTDESGKVSSLRVLIMEKRWVDIHKTGCCAKLNYKFSQMFKRKNIADVSKRAKSTPLDIVDKFWMYKFEEQNHQSRERDFLRYTTWGRVFFNCQILRPYVLFFAVITLSLFPNFKVSDKGIEMGDNTIIYNYLIVDTILAFPLLYILVVEVIMKSYLRDGDISTGNVIK